MSRDQGRALTLIALSQLLALSLWFSASAVAPVLRGEWALSTGEEAWLTLAVQVGFVTGALVAAVANLADVVPSRRLFVGGALAAALVNLGLVTVGPESVGRGIALRFLTGVFLAGVYPSGLKVMSGWFRRGRGMALGVMVGALTVGSATPHLLGDLGLDWRGVVIGASMLAVTGSVVMLAVADGPYEVPSPPFRWSQVAHVVTNRGVRLATYGYLGHMWELYAMWTWVGAYLLASASSWGRGYPSIGFTTFAVIAVGGLGSWVAGVLADRWGRTRVAGGAMVASGCCALASAAVFGAHPLLVIPVMVVWGLTIVADSAQFSTMVTETADDDTRGTALTLQTAVGFLLTMVTIRAVPEVVGVAGWRWAFPFLALGPALGVVAMVRLARSPLAARIAGGRG